MPRIQKGMHLSRAATALCGKSISARLCCLRVAQKAAKRTGEIRGDKMTTLRRIDRMGIYEHDLYVLFSRICDHDCDLFLNILFAYEYRLIGRPRLLCAVAAARDRKPHGIDHGTVAESILGLIALYDATPRMHA